MVKICFYPLSPREESTVELEEIIADLSATRLEDIVTESSTPQIDGTVTESSTPRIEEIITEDGILCLILSNLKLKEAVRTSILSSRWRHIWTHLTKFDFSAITVFDGHTLEVRHIGGIEAFNETKGKTAEFIQSVDSVLRQLQGARLHEFEELNDLPKGSSRFIHLTRLDFEWDVGVEMSLLHLTSLMNAAPLLKELKLCLSTDLEEPPQALSKLNEMQLSTDLEEPPQALSKLNEMVPKHPRTHLKTIEVSGFYFEAWQIVIAVYLLNNATELKTMTIHKGSKLSRFVPNEILETGMKNLRQVVPANANLVIL